MYEGGGRMDDGGWGRDDVGGQRADGGGMRDEGGGVELTITPWKLASTRRVLGRTSG